MVQVMQDDTYDRYISMSFSWLPIALTGLAIGALYFILTFLVGHFVIDPMYCKSTINVAACSNSIGISGNVAAILSGVVGLGVLATLRVARPIIVAVASAILLWGLSNWTIGLAWGEVVVWSALLYGMAYILFAWISRYNETIPVLIVAILISVVARIVVSL